MNIFINKSNNLLKNIFIYFRFSIYVNWCLVIYRHWRNLKSEIHICNFRMAMILISAHCQRISKKSTEQFGRMSITRKRTTTTTTTTIKSPFLYFILMMWVRSMDVEGFFVNFFSPYFQSIHFLFRLKTLKRHLKRVIVRWNSIRKTVIRI